MCFSPEADLVAAVVIGAAGIDGLRHVTRPDQIPMSLLPATFALHQLDEVFVWWGLRGQVSPHVLHVSSWMYLIVAFGLLPVLAPLSVAVRDSGVRRKFLFGFVTLGAVVAAVLTNAVVRGPITTHIVRHHISYRVVLGQGTVWVILYVVATCGAFLFSGHPHIRIFGVVNLVAVGLLAALQRSAFISLWCAWAAITSIAIALHFRNEHSSGSRAPQLVPEDASG